MSIIGLHPMKEAIREQARIVQQAREDARETNEYLAGSRQSWERMNAGFIQRAKELTEQQTVAESQLRELALMRHADTQDKHPGSGVEIGVGQHLDYSPAEAFSWALEHKIALTLNVKVFESIAKTEPTRIDFVEISEEASATIATDLGKALEKEEA